MDNGNPYTTQVGGHHYTDLKIQPFHLALELGGTPGFCKVAKYLVRQKDHPVKEARKARHICLLEKADKALVDELYINRIRGPKLIIEVTKFTTDPDIAMALVDVQYGKYDAAVELIDKIIHKRLVIYGDPDEDSM